MCPFDRILADHHNPNEHVHLYDEARLAMARRDPGTFDKTMKELIAKSGRAKGAHAHAHAAFNGHPVSLPRELNEAHAEHFSVLADLRSEKARLEFENETLRGEPGVVKALGEHAKAIQLKDKRNQALAFKLKKADFKPKALFEDRTAIQTAAPLRRRKEAPCKPQSKWLLMGSGTKSQHGIRNSVISEPTAMRNDHRKKLQDLCVIYKNLKATAKQPHGDPLPFDVTSNFYCNF